MRRFALGQHDALLGEMARQLWPPATSPHQRGGAGVCAALSSPRGAGEDSGREGEEEEGWKGGVFDGNVV